LQDVFAFEVGVVGEEFLNRVAAADHTDDHTDCDPHAANAGAAAHDFGLLSDSVELFYWISPCA